MSVMITKKEANEDCLTILDRIFDNILELNCSEQTMRCAKWSEKTEVWLPSNIRMVLKDAVDFWVSHVVAEEDRDSLRALFKKACEKSISRGVIKFRLKEDDGLSPLYVGELICTPRCCWLCFNNSERLKDRLSLRETSDYTYTENVEQKVFIQTFGYFDVFVNGSAVLFRSKKAKELLALLVDRKGGYLSSNEAISYLWEDEAADDKTLSRYRKVAMRLNDTLKAYGIESIIENIDGKRRIVPERVSCDLYDYLSDREKNKSKFNGNYMLNYSWGEITLASL